MPWLGDSSSIHSQHKQECHHCLPAKHAAFGCVVGRGEAAGGASTGTNMQRGNEGRVDQSAKDRAKDLRTAQDSGDLS